ncbi:helix-turn-helix transcriptional regulator [Pseudorhodoferax sp.]|uniref:helix-turn-helix transcriptional regulator n=1 Tax=Pseudorhodoferax sp. TaxID=1993553 RepID=UPI002DD66060|nr:LuxR C-terminal-related transcriptional regulator [Pseudorhodoferax sp.]
MFSTVSNPARQASDVSAPVQPAALQTALMAGLDRLAHGVAVLDAAGRTLFANTSARALFARLGWTDTISGQGQHGRDWSAALDRVCRSGRRELVTLNLHRATLVAALSPLDTQPSRLAFVLFGRDEICGSVELQMLALQHKLTSAETEVLRQLCRGMRAADIARAHGVARTTVLTQIAAIRSKTGSASVRSLLDAMARMPQMVPLRTVTAFQGAVHSALSQ